MAKAPLTIDEFEALLTLCMGGDLRATLSRKALRFPAWGWGPPGGDSARPQVGSSQPPLFDLGLDYPDEKADLRRRGHPDDEIDAFFTLWSSKRLRIRMVHLGVKRWVAAGATISEAIDWHLAGFDVDSDRDGLTGLTGRELKNAGWNALKPPTPAKPVA